MATIRSFANLTVSSPLAVVPSSRPVLDQTASLPSLKAHNTYLEQLANWYAEHCPSRAREVEAERADIAARIEHLENRRRIIAQTVSVSPSSGLNSDPYDPVAQVKEARCKAEQLYKNYCEAFAIYQQVSITPKEADVISFWETQVQEAQTLYCNAYRNYNMLLDKHYDNCPSYLEEQANR